MPIVKKALKVERSEMKRKYNKSLEISYKELNEYKIDPVYSFKNYLNTFSETKSTNLIQSIQTKVRSLDYS